MKKRIRLIKEFWPGQTEKLRTARIEVIDPNEKWPIKVGRLTCEDPLFSWLYEEIYKIGEEKDEKLD